MTASADRLVQLVTPAVADAGYDLEGLTVSAAGRRSVVRVVVDKDGGVTLDDVAEVSRRLGQTLDAADEAEPSLLGPSYVLEVSSPGVDRPLTDPRHWRRSRTRLVNVVLVDGEVTGRVVSADDEGVVLDVDGAEQVVLAYARIVRGAVQVEFSRTGEAPTLDEATDDEPEQDDA